jgi:hypothetical protein
MIPAFRLRAPSVRFIALAIFATGVRAFECDLSSFTSSFDQGLRCAVFVFVGKNNLLNALFERSEVAWLHQRGCHKANLAGRGEIYFSAR